MAPENPPVEKHQSTESSSYTEGGKKKTLHSNAVGCLHYCLHICNKLAMQNFRGTFWQSETQVLAVLLPQLPAQHPECKRMKLSGAFNLATCTLNAPIQSLVSKKGNKTKTCSHAHACCSGLAPPEFFPAAALFILLSAFIVKIKERKCFVLLKS